jgi:hypothetical protein
MGIQDEIFARLEQERLERIEASQASLATDRKALEGAMKDLADQVPPERLRRLAGLIGLVSDQQAQADAAAKAVGDPPVIPAGGWLAMGQVRDFDGSPAKGGQVNFEGSGDAAARLLKPVKIGADGQVRLSLGAEAVAEFIKSGETQVQISAQVDDRTVEDIAPAKIVANGVHRSTWSWPRRGGRRGLRRKRPHRKRREVLTSAVRSRPGRATGSRPLRSAGSWLINDSRRRHIRAFDMVPNGTLARQTDRVFSPTLS